MCMNACECICFFFADLETAVCFLSGLVENKCALLQSGSQITQIVSEICTRMTVLYVCAAYHAVFSFLII